MAKGKSQTFLDIQFGLISMQKHYLTAETFGFSVNAKGANLKPKQTWTLEQDNRDGDTKVFLRSHLGRYLTADRDGKVIAEAETPDAESRFIVLPQADGRWALKSEAHGRFLGLKHASASGAVAVFGGHVEGKEEIEVCCFAQSVLEPELWVVHLAMHPQVCLYSTGRRQYARLNDDQLTFDRNIPWGVSCLIMLDFQDGRYSLKACDNRYVRKDGRLVNQSESGTKYVLEFKAGSMAFKAEDGKYLSAVGPSGTLQVGKNSKAGKDDFFLLTESHPQVVILSYDGRVVTTCQGIDITSLLGKEEKDEETFQLEMEKGSGKVVLRTMHGSFWIIVKSSRVQSTGRMRMVDSYFDIEWRGRRIAIKASTGKYLSTLKNGQICSTNFEIGKSEEFILKLINRPIVVLRGEYGFIACRADALDCNRSSYEVFRLDFQDGAYTIQASNGKFWSIGPENVVGLASGATPFLFEFIALSRIAIRAPNGKYVQGDQAGLLTAKADCAGHTSFWEY
uniref:Fascin n=1 Tax=Eptatretus burgeri TaxID=7764 RepID=A0A8C4WZV1_EPTBU